MEDFLMMTIEICEAFVREFHRKVGPKIGPMRGVLIERMDGSIECALLPSRWDKPIPKVVAEDIEYMLNRLTAQELMMYPDILDTAFRIGSEQDFYKRR